ncbi:MULTISPECIES: universal stress protein [unclassified Streptomyces]|uniref:universal stress protein n=1 Tax=unclassified Streptomyces TaxID=2593676 RepID=UPI0040418E5D
MTAAGRSGTVVVGVDDAPDAWSALDWAAAEAERGGDALRILHAVDAGAEPTGPADEADPHVQAGVALLDDAQARVAAARPGLAADAVLARGHPAEALIEAARDAGARLVVVGTRGRGGFTGLLLGSVGLRLAAHTDRPVAVVRGEHTEDDALHDVVVVGVHDERDEDVVRFGLEEAARRGTTARLLHAWTPFPRSGLTAPQVSRLDDARRLHERLLDRALDPVAAHPKAHADTDFVIGSPAGVLVEASARAGLLVVGRRPPRGPLGLRLGTVSHAVLHHASCPVAVVPVAGGED